MGVIASFHAKDDCLPAIQRIVKQYNLRFLGNPAAGLGLGGVFVQIECNNAAPRDWSAAMAAIHNIRHPDPPPSPKRGWLARLFQ